MQSLGELLCGIILLVPSCLCKSLSERLVWFLLSDHDNEAVATLAAHLASGSRSCCPSYFLHLGLHPQLALPVFKVDLPPVSPSLVMLTGNSVSQQLS